MDLKEFGSIVLKSALEGSGSDDESRDTFEKWMARWTKRWQPCNKFCMGYILFDWTVLIGHWGMMITQLHGWADGSFFLVGMTYTSTLMTIFSIFLLIGEPLWMMAPYWQRMMLFIWALVSVSSFIGQFIGVVVNYFRGNTPLDTLAEMNAAYFLVLRFADFVPALYVFLFEGLAQSPYSIFNPDYGDWAKVDLTDKDRLYVLNETTEPPIVEEPCGSDEQPCF